MKHDYLKWGALAAALVATASAEYELARAVGFNQWVAAAVPGALDLYTVRALRSGREVLAAVAAMIGVNAASHLVTAGLVTVNVPLVVAVSAIAPLVLWRVHSLGNEQAEGLHTVKDDAPQKVTLAPAIEVELDRPEVTPATAAEVTAAEAAHLLPELTASPVAPLVICGDRRVWHPEFPSRDEDDEVTDPTGDRLPTAAAANVIRAAWLTGTSVTETARQATRSTSYVKKVFARYDEERQAADLKFLADGKAPSIALVPAVKA